MRIYVNYDPDNHNIVRGVHTLSYYLEKGKTIEEIDAALQTQNKEHGWEIFRTFEVSDELETVFRFMLGENEYKSYASINSVYRTLKDIKDDIDSIRDDTYYMNEFLESTLKDVEKLVSEEQL